MFRILFTAVALTLGLCLSAVADGKSSSRADHHEEAIRLTDQQVDAGGFAIVGVRGGELRKHIGVPGTIVPSGDRIARVAVRLLGTVVELRKRLGDRVEAGDVVAVIESREVADAKSEYLAARLVFDLQKTLFERATRLFDSKVLSENDYLRARTTFEDARVKIETARQKLFALSLTAEQIEALPQQPVETLRLENLNDVRIAQEFLQVGRILLALRDLHDIRGAVAIRQLHDAKPVAVRIETHGLGIDRRRMGVAAEVRQIAAMQADGHGDSVQSCSSGSRSCRSGRSWFPSGLNHPRHRWQTPRPTQRPAGGTAQLAE